MSVTGFFFVLNSQEEQKWLLKDAIKRKSHVLTSRKGVVHSLYENPGVKQSCTFLCLFHQFICTHLAVPWQ